MDPLTSKSPERVGRERESVEFSPESLRSPEQVVETPESFADRPQAELGPTAEASVAARVTSTPIVRAPEMPKDRLTEEIEDVLEDRLGELYLSLSPQDRQKFKATGEETTRQIRELVRAAHVNVKKILHLIRDWLKLIPAVNRYFLEQEAKIKTDKILMISEEEKKRGSQ